jgi:tetratricopeptide (TPR) repeat protein
VGVRARLGPALVVAMATALAFLPALANDFVDFDDQTNLIENPSFRGLGPAALGWMFTNLDGHYLPLTWLSFAVDYTLWGMNPLGYHLTNLVLHVTNAVLFYGVSVGLLRLAFAVARGTERPALFTAAGLSAALFALHPLRVESVAWATERRDVLSGLFFLATILTYLRTQETTAGQSAAPRFAWRALAFYLLSLLAKPVGMSLPLVLVVLDIYPLRRLRGDPRAWLGRELRVVWIEKLPFVVLGVATAVVEGVAEGRIDTFYSLAEYGVSGRVGQVFFALAFYLWKTLVPLGLSPLYQLPVGWRFLRADVLVAAAGVTALTVALVALSRRWPWALAAWAAYAALLAPVLGIAQAGPHIVADRYSYLATLGWAAVAGGLVLGLAAADHAGRARPGCHRLAVGGVTAIALFLGMLTWRQAGIWHDSITLWETAVATDADCYICKNNLGNALVRAGRAADAVPYFEAALRIQPGDADAYANLGTAATQQGRDDEARRQFEAALRIDPDHPTANTNLARLLINEGKSEQAIPHLETALRKEPMMAEAHTNLGLARMHGGDLDGAERSLRTAVRILPDDAVVHNNLGILLLRRDQHDAAVAEFQRACELDPSFPEAWFNLGLALSAAPRPDEATTALREAMSALREAIRLRPSYASAHQQLADLLAASGATDEALAHAAEAARLAPEEGSALAITYMEADRPGDAIRVLRGVLARDPADADAAGMLAWLLATSRQDELRDGKAAVVLAERSLGTDAQEAPDADRLDTLAAAYAEVGRFADAIATARRAEAAARAAGSADLAAEIATRLLLYEEGRPFRVE